MKILIGKQKIEAPNVFFTSDTHFGHANIIRFCNRPFESVDEMNQVLVDNWNKVISPDDVVYHLGDFCFGGLPAWEHWRNQLNGKIHLILGNHDVKNVNANNKRMYDMFETITYQQQIMIEDYSIYLNHYPFLCFGGAYRGVWQLFGHVHSSPVSTGLDTERLVNLFPTQYDIGVDNNNFTPVSFEQVRDIILAQSKNKTYDRY